MTDPLLRGRNRLPISPRHALTAALIAPCMAWAAAQGLRSSSASEIQQEPSGTWHTYANADDVLALAGEGSVLWSGSRHGGLVRWDTTTGAYEQFLAPQDPIPANNVRAIAVDQNGWKWLATNHGLTVLVDKGTPDRSDDEWATFTREGTTGGLPTDDVWAVAPDGNTVWVGGAQVYDQATEAWVGGGLGRLDHRGTLDPSDDVWAPPITFEATRSEPPNGQETVGLVSDSIRALLIAPDGGLWVGGMPHWRFETDGLDPGVWRRVHGGMSHLDPGGTFETSDDSWRAYSCETPLRDTESRPVITCTMGPFALDGAGHAWVTAGGLGAIAFPSDQAILSARSVERFDDEIGMLGSPAETVAAGEGPSEVWIGLRQTGVIRLNVGASLSDRTDDTDARWDETSGLPAHRVQALAGEGGVMWVGMGPVLGNGAGIAAIQGGDPPQPATTRLITAAPAGHAPPSNFVTDLAVGEPGTEWDGSVWLATGSRRQQRFGIGVARFDPGAGEQWRLYDSAGTDDTGGYGGLAGDNVHAVLVDGDSVWFGSAETDWNDRRSMYLDGGVSVFSADRWTARGPEEGLFDGSVATLSQGCSGEIWIGFGSEWSFGRGADVLTSTEVHDPSADSWEHFAYPQLPSGNVRGVGHNCTAGETWVAGVHDAQGGSWAGGGVSRRSDAGTWSRFDVTNGFNSFGDGVITGEATSLLVTGSDVWVGAFGDLETTEQDLVTHAPYLPAPVNRYAGGVWSSTVFARLGSITDLAADSAGRIWAAASRGGLARDGEVPEDWVEDPEMPGVLVRVGESWRQLDWAAGQPFSDVSAIAAASDGDVWIASEGWGIARYTEKIPPTPTPSATHSTEEPTGTALTPTPTGTSDGTEVTPTASPSAATGTPTPTGSSTEPGTPPTPTGSPTEPDGHPSLYLPSLLRPLRH